MKVLTKAFVGPCKRKMHLQKFDCNLVDSLMNQKLTVKIEYVKKL